MTMVDPAGMVALIRAELGGCRFPSSMLPHAAAGRLLRSLGVQIVDDCDAGLEEFARAWLLTVPVGRDDAPSTVAVRRALKLADGRRAA